MGHNAVHAEHISHEDADPKLRFVPLVAAIFAVLAGLAGILAARLGDQVLSFKNDAVLHQASASDLWNEYQAESLKAHLYEIGMQTSPAIAKTMSAEAKKYRDEQPGLTAHARKEENARDAALSRSNVVEVRKSNLEIALAFFEVAIVLSSIAAMIKQLPAFWLSVVFGIVGFVFGLRGALGF
jgi:hypothetical protein